MYMNLKKLKGRLKNIAIIFTINSKAIDFKLYLLFFYKSTACGYLWSLVLGRVELFSFFFQ